MLVIKRDGRLCDMESDKIFEAIKKAFDSLHYGEWEDFISLTDKVLESLPKKEKINVEEIQDIVEQVLLKYEPEVHKVYSEYRVNRAQQRHNKWLQNITSIIRSHVLTASVYLKYVKPELIVNAAVRDMYIGITEDEMKKLLILAARTLIETDPEYSKVAARLLLQQIYSECDLLLEESIEYGIGLGLLSSQLLELFDLELLDDNIDKSRDLQFEYLGLQTLYDRYLLVDKTNNKERRIETPQNFFMRVAMGLAIKEDNPTEKAIEFYKVLSQFDFMSSTPTLFNSGTNKPQLSSCYLTTIGDDIDEIFDGIKENAKLSKWAGGLGNDWTPVRALGSLIKGTNGKSQGVIPFLKVVNDTAVAVNQGGKRKGAVCAYLETWHLDIEEFLDLRKNTGDDRRRTHDMNTANWIPDLFMERVIADTYWTLFSPSDVPDLHDLYGYAFKERYIQYESDGMLGKIRYKTVSAPALWRKMLNSLFETGHPWITFKDACNICNPQAHVGVIHSSNLCTEITLNTSSDEIAVCNLGSVNMVNHLLPDGNLDHDKLQKTISSAVRMLDNVIDINYYPVDKACNSNLRHRPIGLGIMGFQDCLYIKGIPYDSYKAVEFANESMEAIAYYTYLSSSELSEERGSYSTYEGSNWSNGILPHVTYLKLMRYRGNNTPRPNTQMGWYRLYSKPTMRNSNCLAIAPTATISNIVGVSASIEPTYQNLYVKSNLSGEFTCINKYLVEELKMLGLWDNQMISDLKRNDGSVQNINRVPDNIKSIYKTAFEIDQTWLIKAAAARQVWIDQAQSLNLYVSNPSGKKLDELYRLAWSMGLKTTYYLRTLGATGAEKSTGDGGELNSVKVCSIDNPDCEVCQ